MGELSGLELDWTACTLTTLFGLSRPEPDYSDRNSQDLIGERLQQRPSLHHASAGDG